MKLVRLSVLLLVLASVGAGLVFAYLEMRKERDLEASAEAPVIAPSRVIITTAGATVRLDAETQRRLGVETAPLIEASMPDEVRANARVLDGANLATLLAEARGAEAALDATRSEYERKRKLAGKDQNVSASAVEEATAAMKKDEAAHAVARAKTVAQWGAAVTQRADLGTLAEALLRREQAIVRVELLATDRLDAVPERAVLERLDGFTAAAQLLGPAPSSENPLAGQCLLYLVAGRAESLVSGTALTARLVRAGRESAGWLVPRGAVVRHAGLGWIYLKTDAETFARREIALDRAVPDGWLVGENTGTPVVVAGAQSLLSEELKGGIQMKD